MHTYHTYTFGIYIKDIRRSMAGAVMDEEGATSGGSSLPCLLLLFSTKHNSTHSTQHSLLVHTAVPVNEGRLTEEEDYFR